ncbi:MAG TPA: hypothetical protein VEC57_04135 [Candidatus Limnocylindrales bacterium]|nr:hypothetical protein [Candidatus Limnocylindrales bacterium]
MKILARGLPRRARVWLAAVALAACTPVSQSYIVHSADLTCDEANRVVYASIGDMGMKVTSFSPAAPGRAGKITAVGPDRRGDVSITCDAAGVHIDPNQATMGDKSFERGIFLSVTGRAGLSVAHGNIEGRAGAPAADGSAGAGLSAAAPARPAVRTAAASAPEQEPAGAGMTVRLEPQRGFSTVLDFDADLASAGILPIRVSIRNGTARSYTFDPKDIVVRVRGSRTSADPLSAADAAARLSAAAGAGGKQTNIGNVASATKIMTEKALAGARLGPGASTAGYVYYPVGDYDRAKVTMTDVETGELEGFSVEF